MRSVYRAMDFWDGDSGGGGFLLLVRPCETEFFPSGAALLFVMRAAVHHEYLPVENETSRSGRLLVFDAGAWKNARAGGISSIGICGAAGRPVHSCQAELWRIRPLVSFLPIICNPRLAAHILLFAASSRFPNH